MKTISLLLFILTINLSFSQTSLSAGDIVITGFNSDNPDEFTFVLLKDVVNSTQINFTDRGWINSVGFRTSGEGVITWEATADLSCGTEITIRNDSPFSASIGTVTDSAQLSLATTQGDQILAYQGAIGSPAFIYALNYNDTGWTDATTPSTSGLPVGLTNGITAIAFASHMDNGNYNCVVTDNPLLILPNVSNASNWNLSNNPIASLGGCSYTCSTCTSVTIWNGSDWDNGTPDISTLAVINNSYNTGTDGSFSACSLIVKSNLLSGSEYRLTVDDGTFVEVENNVDVFGEIHVETQGSFVQNNDSSSFNVNSGATTLVNKTTAHLTNWYDFTYWSSPVVGETAETALSLSPTYRRFSFSAVDFVDLEDEIDNTGIIVPGQDDIDDDSDAWQLESGILTPGSGCAASVKPAGFTPGTFTATFTGAFNNGVISTPVVANSGGVYNDWNFIGNPYPSPISANSFFAANGGVITEAIYLWSSGIPLNSNTSGNSGANNSNLGYAIVTSTGINIAGGSGVMPDNFIPSGQGFFVEAITPGNVVFNNTMRETGNNTQFFRSNTIPTNALWIDLTTNTGIFSQLAVAYINGATNLYDDAPYDVKRNLSSDSSAIIYSQMSGDTKGYAIQGKDANSLTVSETISIGFKATVNANTPFSLSIAQFQGDFFDNNTVYLKDNLLNIEHNLSNSPYTFSSATGDFKNRFELRFQPETLSLIDDETTSTQLTIIDLNDGNVKFSINNGLSIKQVEIFDVLGRTIQKLNSNSDNEIYNFSNISNATYIAKVQLSNGQELSKRFMLKK